MYSSSPTGRPEEPDQANGPIGPPSPPSGDDGPLILPSAGGGRGQMVSPAGMYPHSMTTQAHQGREVPGEAKAAYGAATNMQLSAADQEAAANRDYYQQTINAQTAKMQAADAAASQHARIQADRDAMVKQRLADIEATNAEANAAIDPDKYWEDRGAAAHVLGIIGVMLSGYGDAMLGRENGALKIIENGINRNIDAQIQNRKAAGDKATRKEHLLDLHMQALGDKDKAIDATKLALWDNVAGQVDQYAAQNKSRVSDAAALKLKADILEKRGEVANKIALQEADDINKAYSEQYRPAQYAGGASGGGKANMEGYELIPVPASDQTAEKGMMVAVPKDTHKSLSDVVGSTNAIIGINQDALTRIKEMRADWPKVLKGDGDAYKRLNANKKTLDDLAQRKASLISQAEGQGVLREPEFKRSMAERVHFADWMVPGANVEKRLQAQNNGLTGAAGRMVQGAGGQVVRMAYRRDQNGALQPNPLFTGKTYVPLPVSPELGEVK